MIASPCPIDLSCDHHVHTRYCGHAQGEMEEYVQAAISKGLRKIIFLEHMEAGIDCGERSWLTDQDFDRYFTEGHRLQQYYRDQLTIGLGVELGYNPDCRDELLTRLGLHDWDQIGLSYHYMPIPDRHGRLRHLNLVSRKPENIRAMQAADPSQLLSHYFMVLTEAITVIRADHICHLDAALRFVPNLCFSLRHHEEIAALLDQIAAHHMALEINTSGFVIRGVPYPDRPIIAQALALGIPLVASSDAHRPADVGRFFDRLPDILQPGSADT